MSKIKQKIINNKKQCSKCKKWKSLKLFTKKFTTSSGYRSECKICQYNLHKKWFNKLPKNRIIKYKKNTLDYGRIHYLSTNGKKIRNLEKRKYPKNNKCELCRNIKKRLEYHHWGKRYNIGIWICWKCHRFVEFIDKCYEKYIRLKNKVTNRIIVAL